MTNHHSQSLRLETGGVLSSEGRSGMEASCVSEFELLMGIVYFSEHVPEHFVQGFDACGQSRGRLRR